ncbi:Plasma membrane iron permease [Auxenochlorella protothecoides]|uniref:Plasma membrane iron permease n=1 Tax=Auxenochlorella protothecoides TaxID=3075 RepID=A0A087SM15_AUXPR|nr:Plasma membrane iron permease [Auxenochlorella protothecoides]KFM26769.1 Plasma membrane iron permease [Auxenochlorella protothecoides]RMZ55778.1 hypothetical protein APUTEX25_005819 [Auxenochlorella protothecoides]|eukprot:RMZ55778.1 hypothetical protein APUTEX25_005819 [Auxenochlorella protothecoides]
MTYFSLAALFIMFRETLEAAIIVAVLLQLMERLKMPELKRWVWIGAAAGVGVALIVGVVFIVLFYVANNSIFTGNAENLFKGFIFYIAVLLIVYVSFHMLKFYNLEKKWRYKLEQAFKEREGMKKSYRYTVAFLAFSATVREGIESVLFLTGVSGGQGITSVIIPGIVGAILGLIAGCIIFYTGRSIRSMKWFFIIMTVLLLFIAAGMLMNGTAAFQAAGWFGATYPYEWVPWSNKILWNTMGCCNPDTNEFWSLIRALFGYQAMPTNIQLLYYCLFWFVVLSAMAYRAWLGVLTDEHRFAAEDEEGRPASFNPTYDGEGKLGKGVEGASGSDSSPRQHSSERASGDKFEDAAVAEPSSAAVPAPPVAVKAE